MNLKQIKYELQNLISGKSGASYDALIQTVASHLRGGKRTGPMAKEKHENKTQETEELIEFAKSNHLRIENISKEKIIASGAESVDIIFPLEPHQFLIQQFTIHFQNHQIQAFFKLLLLQNGLLLTSI